MKFLPLLSCLAFAACAGPIPRISTPVSTCCDLSNATCSPTGTCTACKNCKNCSNCKSGGTCSVCKKKP